MAHLFNSRPHEKASSSWKKCLLYPCLRPGGQWERRSQHLRSICTILILLIMIIINIITTIFDIPLIVIIVIIIIIIAVIILSVHDSGQSQPNSTIFLMMYYVLVNDWPLVFIILKLWYSAGHHIDQTSMISVVFEQTQHFRQRPAAYPSGSATDQKRPNANHENTAGQGLLWYIKNI